MYLNLYMYACVNLYIYECVYVKQKQQISFIIKSTIKNGYIVTTILSIYNFYIFLRAFKTPYKNQIHKNECTCMCECMISEILAL